MVHKRIVEASFSVVSPPPTITLYVPWYYQESATIHPGPVLSVAGASAGSVELNWPTFCLKSIFASIGTSGQQRRRVSVLSLSWVVYWLIRRKASPESSSDVLQWFYSSVYVGGTDRMTGLVWGRSLCVHLGAIWSTYRIKQKIEKRTWPATLW